MALTIGGSIPKTGDSFRTPLENEQEGATTGHIGEFEQDGGQATESKAPEGETEAQREAREISERTGKPKKAPRGKPFQRGSDARRKQEQGEGGQGEGEGAEAEGKAEGKGSAKGESKGEQGEGAESDGAEGEAEAPKLGEGEAPKREAPKAGLSIEDMIRELARQEAGILDHDLAGAVVAHVEQALKHLPKDAAEDAKGAQRFRIEMESVKSPKVKTLKGVQHKAFGEVMGRLEVGFRNLLLVGPAGSGKTTLGHQIADALERPFASVSCSAGMSEGVLLGRLLPTGEHGRFEYAPAPFVEMYEQGGVFLLDEVDAADSNVLLVLNSALANGHLDVPNRLHNPVAMRHPDFVLMAAGNTFGQGANRMYVGRNQLDAAFLSRFAGTVIEMGYDTAMEDKLAVTVGETVGLKPETVAPFVAAFRQTRQKIETGQLRRMWGTRELLAGVRLLGQKGATPAKVGLLLMAGWTADEMARAGAK